MLRVSRNPRGNGWRKAPHKRELVPVNSTSYTTLQGEKTNDVQQHVIASTPFLEANPAAKRWFELIKMPVSDINEQNLKMREGEKTEADVARHADEWGAAHQEQWDAWIAEAKEAVP